jgi:hypothetical protein
LDGFVVHEIYPGSASKNARIFNMLKTIACEKPTTLLHAEVRSAVVNQVSQWNPAKVANIDDVLDLLTYCERILFENAGSLMRVFELTSSGNAIEAAYGHELELAF